MRRNRGSAIVSLSFFFFFFFLGEKCQRQKERACVTRPRKTYRLDCSMRSFPFSTSNVNYILHMPCPSQNNLRSSYFSGKSNSVYL